MPAVHEVLATAGCRILDVGCGAGWVGISLARAYPSATVLGVDIDQPSLNLAVRNAREGGVDDRVRFVCQDAASLPGGTVDVAFAFECVHDMPRPVEVLEAVRRTLAPGGSLVVMDEAVADAFAPDGDELERIMYGFSLLVCLPDGLSSAPDPQLEMHPSAAAARGVSAGDWVSLDTPFGSVRARAKLNASLDPQVVFGQHGWWEACEELGLPGYPPYGPDSANLNLVLRQTPSDPVSGSSPLRASVCDVTRLGASGAEAIPEPSHAVAEQPDQES